MPASDPAAHPIALPGTDIAVQQDGKIEALYVFVNPPAR